MVVVVAVLLVLLVVVPFALSRRRAARERWYAQDGPRDANWSGGGRTRDSHAGGAFFAGVHGDGGGSGGGDCGGGGGGC